jgi:hypothetical protein
MLSELPCALPTRVDETVPLDSTMGFWMVFLGRRRTFIFAARQLGRDLANKGVT